MFRFSDGTPILRILCVPWVIVTQTCFVGGGYVIPCKEPLEKSHYLPQWGIYPFKMTLKGTHYYVSLFIEQFMYLILLLEEIHISDAPLPFISIESGISCFYSFPTYLKGG